MSGRSWRNCGRLTTILYLNVFFVLLRRWALILCLFELNSSGLQYREKLLFRIGRMSGVRPWFFSFLAVFMMSLAMAEADR